MSGAWVHYHLRQNKAVDRQLLIDLLTKLNRYVPVQSYEYIGFGGAFLEDFKLVHNVFGNKKLKSIEVDDHVWKRQKFNLPLNCIKRKKMHSSQFVDSYTSAGNSIIWLDYTAPNERRTQIMEFERLLPKLKELDIVKITLNANPESLRESNSTDKQGKRMTLDAIKEIRLEKISSQLGDYLPQDVSKDDTTKEGFPGLLSKAIHYAANKGMEGNSGCHFQILSAFAYADLEHQMLTITGMILPKSKRREFFTKTGLRNWKLGTYEWGSYKNIKIPALTVKEKIFIDQLLPTSSSQEIQEKLKFQFDKKPTESIAAIDNYKTYYRYYPNFQRVLL